MREQLEKIVEEINKLDFIDDAYLDLDEYWEGYCSIRISISEKDEDNWNKELDNYHQNN